LGRDILNHTSEVAFLFLNGLSVFSLKKWQNIKNFPRVTS
jgi:hypothetical protein